LIVGFFIKVSFLKPLPSLFFAISGAFVHEILYFLLGRWKGREFLLGNSVTRRKYRKAKKLVEKYGIFSIFIIRFLYGMRVVPMVLFGATGFSMAKFSFFNILSLIIWAFLYIGLGYVFGHTAEKIFGKAKEYYLIIAGIIVLLGTLYLLYSWIKSKREKEALANKD